MSDKSKDQDEAERKAKAARAKKLVRTSRRGVEWQTTDDTFYFAVSTEAQGEGEEQGVFGSHAFVASIQCCRWASLGTDQPQLGRSCQDGAGKVTFAAECRGVRAKRGQSAFNEARAASVLDAYNRGPYPSDGHYGG
jgi:hypothetical protein